MGAATIAEILADYAPTSVRSASAALERKAQLPPTELVGWVSRCWTLQGRGERVSVSMLPDACVDLVVVDLTARPRVLLAPSRSVAGTMVLAPDVRFVAVRLQPAAAFALLGLPIDELPEHIDLTGLLGALGREMVERVVHAPTLEVSSRHLERYLSTRSRSLSIDDRVQRAMAAIQASGGALDIGEVARMTGIGTRTLDRLFPRWTGVTPKRFSRIIRFQRIVTAAKTHVSSWSALAASFGLADQAHLVREVRAFSGGTTPTRFRVDV